MTLQVTRRRFTVAGYDRMAEAGILTEDDRVELVDGELIQMAPIGRRHAASVDRLTHLFTRLDGDVAQVRIQNPVRLGDDSEPVPDVMLLNPKPDFYASAHPVPNDVLLLVEVADSSTEWDREIKGPLYARNAIREVWLVDLTGGVVTVYRDPSFTGYQSVQSYRRGDWLSLLAVPGRALAVADALG